jgi:hypothetical protein
MMSRLESVIQRSACREAESMVSVAGLLFGHRRLRPSNLAVALCILCGLTGCNNDSSDVDAKSLQCAKKQYSDFNPKNMKQCVDVCMTCERGSMTTCSTSCTMKGAK